MLNYKYLIVLILLMFAKGCANHSSCLKELKLSDKFLKKQKKLICKNNSIRNIIELYQNDIEDSIIIEVLEKFRTQKYPLNKTVLALELYAKLGTNWSFESDSNLIHKEFDSVDKYLEFDSIYTKNFLESLTFNSSENRKMQLSDIDTEVNEVYIQTELPFKLAKKHKDSLEYYRSKKDMIGLKIFIDKIMLKDKIHHSSEY